MSTPPAPRLPLRMIAGLLPAGRGWWLVLGAFLAGLLLFALVLSGKRDEFDFHRAGDGPRGAPGQVFEPLPAPLPAGESTASGMDDERGGEVRIDRHAEAPAPPPGTVDPSAQAAGTDDVPAAAVEGPVPRLLSAPAPEYPRSALRAGASGNVVLRIEVRPDGRVGEVSVVESSRHRELDRAAARAVRRWRFQPALHDGRPVAGVVQQVISFDAPR